MKEQLFLHIAEQTGLYGAYSTSTTRLGKSLNISQQSASRLLRELGQERKILKESSADGTQLRLSARGRKEIERRYATLRTICTPRKSVKGKVFTGLGEGAYYVKIYSGKIKKALGFTPFPGTLNLRVPKTKAKEFLHGMAHHRIPGFSRSGRSFGAVTVAQVLIQGVPGAVLRPERTTYDDGIVEVIAPVNLRKKLRVKDGGTVEVTNESE